MDLRRQPLFRDAGGEVLVQEPGSAFCKGMPTSIVVGDYPVCVLDGNQLVQISRVFGSSPGRLLVFLPCFLHYLGFEIWGRVRLFQQFLFRLR